MIVWVIVVVYQGDFVGIELVTISEKKADKEYEGLLRDAIGMPQAPWGDVVEAYSRALDACEKIDEIYLRAVEVA